MTEDKVLKQDFTINQILKQDPGSWKNNKCPKQINFQYIFSLVLIGKIPMFVFNNKLIC